MMSAFMLDRMIQKKAKELRQAETESERNECINELDQLIALRKDLKEATGDNFIQIATLGVTAIGIIAPLIANTRLVKECIQFEDTGTWSHPTARNLIGKIKLGK